MVNWTSLHGTASCCGLLIRNYKLNYYSFIEDNQDKETQNMVMVSLAAFSSYS
jgi:hypothetical protein